MYKIDKDGNRILPLREEKFSDLGFTERKHLQEWIVKEPNVFGEELLIIQKEFDGFDETRERLDLLALDKEGNLVIIENKLDDSGRDVVWQALKYASYCSTLSKLEIANIFQDYLNKYCGGSVVAEDLICEFLGESDLGEVALNSDNGQRVIFVAAKYRKEVTSTALWLLSHGIRIQCFKVVPYSMEESLLFAIDRIIPTPEAEEYMIRMSAKREEERDAAFKLGERQELIHEFWNQTLAVLKDSECDLFNRVSPSRYAWLYAGSGKSLCKYGLVISGKEARVQFEMSTGDRDENKSIFDTLEDKKVEIEKTFGDVLEWDRSDGGKSSFVRYRKKIEGYSKENWPEIIEWMVERTSNLEAALKPTLGDLDQNS